ncbi:MAG: class I poly(R)-hydroxyalkanoic acid synthase, partial [Pseudomonadota bacterium]
PAINSYLLGEKRPKFDLLFWNGDSTNLPARMAREYLIRLFRDNELVKDKFDVAGTPVSLKDISVAHYVVAAEKDHIVPWEASFSGLERLRGQGRFVLAQSGHVAGVVNHPAKHKYGYWINEDRPKDMVEWRKGSTAYDGSWWEDWSAWLGRRSGRKVVVENSWPTGHNQLEPAPGRYVKA